MRARAIGDTGQETSETSRSAADLQRTLVMLSGEETQLMLIASLLELRRLETPGVARLPHRFVVLPHLLPDELSLGQSLSSGQSFKVG